ncbi:hypothetical protein C8R43DRAFT_154821 [Mycena crocata]|nr:hypothetical protein C8R43DRAFT_154821 [Mycena crocata]
MSSFDNVPTSNEHGRDTGRSGGDYDNNTESTGFGNTQNDRFDSSNTNTSGGYGQERSDRFDTNANSTMDTGMNSSMNSSSNMGSDMNTGMNTSSNMGSDMNESSFGSSRMDNTSSRTDNSPSEGSNYGGVQRNEFDSASNNRNEFDGTNTGKVSMGDKLRGGAEKMAGKMTGNAGLQERGQERKVRSSPSLRSRN